MYFYKYKMNKTIYCSIHGYTNWEEDLIKIINTSEFQRLKNIKQLAAVHHVFPCAVHTRFEHSLGVGYLAEQYAKTILENQPTLECNPFVLKLAGLCHDLGHGPLSHTFDRFIKFKNAKMCDHEVRSVCILRSIIKKYNIKIEKCIVDDACELIHPIHNNLPKYMYQIISNNIDGIDVDKLDYLKRDSIYTGLNYNIDILRFFQYARVIEDRLCYSFKNMQYTINYVFMIRHQLHVQVYQHPVVRAFENMYIDIMKCIQNAIEFNENLNTFIQFTDIIFSETFIKLKSLEGLISNHNEKKAMHLLDRINKRDVYCCLYEHRINYTLAKSVIDNFKSSNIMIFDIVQIGYDTNPVFDTFFFQNDDTTTTLKSKEVSPLFPVTTKDCLLRLYSRIQKKYINENTLNLQQKLIHE